ncbi:hypothetical protein [Mumia zhuanghuii]|nr:hypothetical protein [Mumia zhuanghuii]
MQRLLLVRLRVMQRLLQLAEWLLPERFGPLQRHKMAWLRVSAHKLLHK